MLTFKLAISISLDVVTALKSELAQAHPQIKSSHLTEAIARGIGFGTHASLLAAIERGGDLTVELNGQLFQAFLSSRSYEPDVAAFWHAGARAAMRRVLSREPHLTHWGYQVGAPKRTAGGRTESATEHYERFVEERDALLNDGVEEFLRSLVLIQQLEPSSRKNPRSGSYGLKHRAEKLISTYPNGASLGPGYVANGSLIVAAVHQGLSYTTHDDHGGYKSVNVTFKMSQGTVEAA